MHKMSFMLIEVKLLGERFHEYTVYLTFLNMRLASPNNDTISYPDDGDDGKI